MSLQRKRLSLVKGRQRFVFHYGDGDESRLMAAFVELAGDDRHDFDWFDAAVLSYEMGRQMEARLAARGYPGLSART